LEANIRFTRLAASRNRGIAPKRGGERDHRQEHEICDELEFKASHFLKPPSQIAEDCLEYFYRREGGGPMSVVLRRAFALVLLAGAVAASLALPAIFDGSQVAGRTIPQVSTETTTTKVFASLPVALKRRSVATAPRLVARRAVAPVARPRTHVVVTPPAAVTPTPAVPAPVAATPAPAPPVSGTPVVQTEKVVASTQAPSVQTDQGNTQQGDDRGNGQQGGDHGNGNGGQQDNGHGEGH
jgi:hypothetical protein